MSDGGKGSAPRPFSVSQEEFANSFERIFGKKDKGWKFKDGCGCFNCQDTLLDPHSMLPVTLSKMIVCPTCGNKRCPRATNHTLDCTNSNDPGQPGSRYE